MWKDLYKKEELKIWLDLSTYCNAACPQCHRTDARSANKIDWLPLVQWSTEEFKKAFSPETMKHITEFQICGTWGDPMMNNDIYEISKYIMEKSDCYILFNTNGSMRNSIWWWKLGHLIRKRGEIYFCIDGINQKMHERYRQKTNLQLVLENMEAYSEFGQSAALTIVFEHNEKHLKDIANLCANYGAENHVFIPTDRMHDNDVFKYYTPDKELQTLERSKKYDKLNKLTFNVDEL